MREFTVPNQHDKKRIDTFLFEMFPCISSSVIFKAFRKRSIKVNNKRVKESFLLTRGDKVEVFIPDEYLSLVTNTEPSKTAALELAYEDDYILVVSKQQGIPVHQDKNQEELILDRWVQAFIRHRDSTISYEDGFPALCHRIDRNTGGLVIFAKDPTTLAVMVEKFRLNEIKKTYQCLVNGVPRKQHQELTAYLKKDKSKSLVTVFDHPVKGALPIVTRYHLMRDNEQFSLLEVELITGRTHQIRAHLSHIGHPILGDGKYGSNILNRSLKLKWQALWAASIKFDFREPSGHLDYLNGKRITLSQIPWESGFGI